MGLFKSDEEKKKDLNQEGVQAADKGEVDKAVKAFQAALKIDPNYVDAMANLGFVYMDQQNFNEALDAFRKVIRVNAKHVEAHDALGTIHALQNKFDAAIFAY